MIHVAFQSLIIVMDRLHGNEGSIKSTSITVNSQNKVGKARTDRRETNDAEMRAVFTITLLSERDSCSKNRKQAAAA